MFVGDSTRDCKGKTSLEFRPLPETVLIQVQKDETRSGF